MNDHQHDTPPQAEDNASILNSVSPQQIAEAIKTAGCAVTLSEQGDVVLLHSASHGIGFQVLWGNAGAPGEYADFTLSCPLRVQGGALPDAILHEWHRSKRFARVAQHGDFVVLEMDVVAAGGVSAPHLAVMLQIWIQMMGQFFLHLRNYPGEAAPPAAVPAAEPAAETVAG
ncbi:YbjN domain-containing protein [Janthinobacterium sp.]|uniref:YbjN domain-containing protein n=1 Tax=Janthinobacterium sp. TaxID=1871054 RepID=UPI00293D7A3F|nr:YbjN domain-containing protein [Janthinobacterium sp.]